MKKIAGLLLSVLFFIPLIPKANALYTASDDSDLFTISEPYYGSITIYSVDARAIKNGVLELPDTLMYEGEEYTVTEFDSSHSYCYDEGELDANDHLYNNISKLILSDSIEKINLDAFGTPVKHFTVVLGENTQHILKEKHHPYKAPNQNLFEFIDIEIGNNKYFSIDGDFLLKDGDIKAYLGRERCIKLPKSASSVGDMKWIESIVTLYIPKNIKTIGHSAFKGCKNLKKITFQKRTDNITIGDFAFADCNNVENLTVPGRLSEDSAACFADMEGLEEVKFAKTFDNKTIGRDMFLRCKNLDKITFPSSVKKIRKRTLLSCSNMKKITVKGNLQTLYYSAFSNCKELEEINFKGKNLTEFRNYALLNAKSLKKITISNTKNAPSFTKKTFKGAAKGIRFYVKNKTVAKKLKANLKKAGYNSAKIYANGKLYK